MTRPRHPVSVALLTLAMAQGCGSEPASPGGSSPSSSPTDTATSGHATPDASGTSGTDSHSGTRLADGAETPGDALRPEPGGMYDRRYCEVLGVTLDMATMTAHLDVYNSLMFGTCPQAQWEALDKATITEQLSVDQVMLNGPRYFLMDSSTGSTLAPGGVETFGEIQMALLATLTLDISEGLPGGGGYGPREVVRNNAWIFDAGREVYELIDAEGHHYVMQSYARIVDTDLSLEDLPALASQLTLPEGWSYQARTLDETLTAQADGIAIVIQDDLQNTYQRYE